MQSMDKKKNSVGTAIKVVWIAAFALIIFGWVVVFAIAEGLLGDIPAISDLQNPINKSASRVYSADGKLMGTWSYATENRIMVPYDSLPANLVKALVATEDERYYEHSGVDARALGRAVVKRGVMGQKDAGGGSTITQQLAKQLYSDVARDETKRLLQKPVEWFIAVQLERCYTKEEIIAMYFNYFGFLNNAVGIKNAAKIYFGKLPMDLSLSECATLVGMCKNPSLYNPFRYDKETQQRVINESCIERRNLVLALMNRSGYITETEMLEAQREPMDVSKFSIPDYKQGIAPYFTEHLRIIMMANRPERSKYADWQYQQYYDDSLAWETDPLYGWCNKHTKKDGSHYNIYTDGLKINTSIDSRMQALAEEASFEHVAKYLQPHFEAEVKYCSAPPYKGLSQEKVNGIVNRYIRMSERYRKLKADGATDEEIERNFNTPVHMTLFKYGADINHPIEYEDEMTPRDSILYYKKFLRTAMCAMDPHTGLVKAYVPGLNFKYFMYDNVLGGGRRQVGSTIKPLLYSMAMMNGWTPCDMVSTAPRSYGGWMPKGGRGAGTIPLKVGLATSNNQVSAYLLNQMNPHQFVNLLSDYGISATATMKPNLTLSLGSCDISVGEMVSAYTAFPSGGVRFAPMLVTSIQDAEGNVLEAFMPRMNEVMPSDAAWRMVTMMEGVIQIGTGRDLRGSYGLLGDLAGKTGTTNNNADGWFIGYVPNLVIGCWVGGEDRDIHFGSMAYGQGAKAALPIFGKFMKKVYAHSDDFGINRADTFNIPRNFELCYDQFEGLERAEGNTEGYSKVSQPTNAPLPARRNSAPVQVEVPATVTDEGEIDDVFQ